MATPHVVFRSDAFRILEKWTTSPNHCNIVPFGFPVECLRIELLQFDRWVKCLARKGCSQPRDSNGVSIRLSARNDRKSTSQRYSSHVKIREVSVTISSEYVIGELRGDLVVRHPGDSSRFYSVDQIDEVRQDG